MEGGEGRYLINLRDVVELRKGQKTREFELAGKKPNNLVCNENRVIFWGGFSPSSLPPSM